MSGALLLYRASGYIDGLTARKGAEAGLKPVLGGRRAEAIESLADELGLESRVVGLDDAERLDAALEGVAAVLNCAGPFTATNVPLAEACMRTGTH